MDIWIVILLFVAGLFGGALSAIAGGASFFTFPALLLAGLPPVMANATNFVALVPSNIAALPAFRSELKQLGKSMLVPIFAGGFGGLVGALFLVTLGRGSFATAVPYLLAVATILYIVAPYTRKFLHRIHRGSEKRNTFGPMLMLFLFSIYGGYFGAGLGQITLAALVLSGYDDFHVTNALKNIVISAISVFAVLIYGLSDSVSWLHALIMMAGATIGGYLGGTISKHIPQTALRFGVIALGSFLTVYYFVSGV